MRLHIIRWGIAIIALFGAITPWIADYNETHIFNPNWPPHAVYHNAQVLAFTTMANAIALVYLFSAKVKSLWFPWILTALYWHSLALAIFFPNTAWLDPPQQADPSQYILGIPGNAFACWVINALLFLLAGMICYGRKRKETYERS